MLHIVVWNGTVTHVYKLNNNPKKPDTRLEQESDYSVEYSTQEPSEWIDPKVYRGKSMHEQEMEDK
jgi:hypothetical protein